MSVETKTKQNTDKTQKKKDDLFKSKINFQLWGLFSMYKRLSLSELSAKLKKSKSTIHPYIKDYLERDIIEVKEEKQIRGNIKAKIYGFKKGYQERIFSCANDKECLQKKEFDKEFGSKIVRETIMKTKLYIKNLETQLQFFEKILNSGINGPDERALNVLKEIYQLVPAKNHMFKKKGVYSINAYNSKTSHELLHKMMNELVVKFNEATAGEEDEFPDLEEAYYFLAFGMPLKKMMEYIKT